MGRMKGGFLVVADGTSALYEGRARAVAEFGRRLAADAGAERDLVVLGESFPQALPWRRVWRIESADGRAIASGLTSLIESHGYGAVFCPDTPLGRELAGRLAGRLGLPVLGTAVAARVGADRIEVTRSVESGRRSARFAVRPLPAIIIADAEVSGPAHQPQSSSPPVQGWPVASWNAGPLFLGEESLSPRDLDVAEAETVIAGGRGVGGPDGFLLLEELAGLLRGAVGASRVAVDLGWAPRSAQIGLTGKTVSPRLYVACGISGAIHHTLGMRDAGFIVAINSDAHAPIFKIANVSIVGDVRQVVPSLIEELRSRATRPAGGEPLLAEVAP